MAADVVGYSRLMGIDEESTLAVLKELRSLFSTTVSEFGGREFGSVGDSLMADFPSAVNAVQCALVLQQRQREENIDKDASRQMQLRVGINLGDVIVEDGSLFGDGVNVASRMQSLAETGGVAISGSVYEQVNGKVEAGFIYSGQQSVRNIAQPVNTYRVTPVAEEKSFSHILSELTRRRVFRTAGAYLVASWVAIQVADVVLPIFEAPGWVLQAIVTLLVAGFPLAIAVTWSFNIGKGGLVATPESRFSRRAGKGLQWGVVGVAGVLSAGILWQLWNGYLTTKVSQPEVRQDAVIENPVFAVAPFVKMVGGDDIAWLGEGAASLVRSELGETMHVRVLSSMAWAAIEEQIDSGADKLAVARAAGINYLVGANYYGNSDGSISLSMVITDLRSGVNIQQNEMSVKNTGEALAQMRPFAHSLKQRLKIPTENSVNQYSADFVSENVAAYEIYILGLQALSDFEYQKAQKYFDNALAIAPDFSNAQYRLALLLEATGSDERAYGLLEQIDIENLSERERLYIEGAKAKFYANRDLDEAIAVYRRLVDSYPNDAEARHNLAEAYFLNHQDEESVQQLETLVETLPQEPASWMALAETHVIIGNTDKARVALKKYLEMRPDDAYPRALSGELEFASGEFEDARSNYSRALEKNPDMAMAKLGLVRSDYVLGDKAKAYGGWVALAEDEQTETIYRIDAAIDYAGAMQGAGRFSQAVTLLEKLNAEINEEGFRLSLALTYRAVSAWQQGDSESAEYLLDQAIQRTPASAQPTRQYFFKGLMALDVGNTLLLDDVLGVLIKLEMSENSQQGWDRDAAVAYLQGLKALQLTSADEALTKIGAAIGGRAYRYRDYDLGHAQVLAAAEMHDDTLSRIDQILARNRSDLRFDLEMDRALARLLKAETLFASGKNELAREDAKEFLSLWKEAPADHPAVLKAKNLLN